MNSVKRLPNFDSVFTLELKNSNPFFVQITLFGANQRLPLSDFPAGVSVEVLESSYVQLLWETTQRPFIIGGMSVCGDLVTSGNSFGTGTPIIRYVDVYGVDIKTRFHVRNYRSIFQKQKDSIDIFPISIPATAEMQAIVFLPPTSDSDITFYTNKRIDPTNMLHNEPILEVGTDFYQHLSDSNANIIVG